MAEILYDFKSDTVTRPTPAMREAMVRAEVGDDMMGEDPTVNRLEAMISAMFGKEAAVFACSGTQSNQMGVRAHCQPGDEVLIHETSHIANFEAGAPAVLSGVTCRALPGKNGTLDVPALQGKVRADDQHLCRTSLVCLENTTNVGGGYAYPLAQVERVSQWAREYGLKVHVDGARFFNASIAKRYSPAEFGRHVDTVSICFSKGLGCPMGSILTGSAAEIARARRARKQFGGALRQAGIVAAAAVYALDHHVARLADDHDNAKLLARLLSEIEGIAVDPGDVETNIVFFEIDPELGFAGQLATALMQRGVRMGPVGAQRLRACTHLDVGREAVVAAADIVRETLAKGILDVAASNSGPYIRG